MTRPFSFARLVAGVVFLNAAGGVLYAVLPILEVQNGGGPLLATLIVGAPLLAQVLATFLWGALSDRWGRRRELLTIGVLGESVLFLAYPFLDPIGLLAVRIVQVFLGAASTLATAVATEDPARPAGHGLGDLSMWGGIGGILGVVAGFPFLGGAEFLGRGPIAVALFALLALLCGASVAFLALSGDLDRPRHAAPLREALRFRSGPWVVRLSIIGGILGLANYVVYTLFPLFVRDVLGLGGLALGGTLLNPTQQLALLSIGAGLGGVIASPLTGRWSESPRWRRRLYLGAPVLYALLWIGFAVLRSYAAIFLLWAVPAAIFYQIPISREIVDLTPREERGRALGLFLSVYSLGGLAGAALAGLGLEAGLDFRTQFLIAALLDLAAFAALLGLRSLRRSPTTQGGEPWRPS